MPLEQAEAQPDVSAHELRRYIEEMTLELADLASAKGETALAASLALVAIQAGAAVRASARG